MLWCRPITLALGRLKKEIPTTSCCLGAGGRILTYLSKRSSASSVGFCWAFSGVGWEACSCSSRRRWISCRISLRWWEALVSDGSFFPVDVFTPSVPPLPSVLRLLILQVGDGYILNSFTWRLLRSSAQPEMTFFSRLWTLSRKGKWRLQHFIYPVPLQGKNSLKPPEVGRMRTSQCFLHSLRLIPGSWLEVAASPSPEHATQGSVSSFWFLPLTAQWCNVWSPGLLATFKMAF